MKSGRCGEHRTPNIEHRSEWGQSNPYHIHHPLPCVISTDDGLVFGSGLPSFGEQGLFRLGGEAVVDDSGQIAEARRESGFRVPGIDESAALSFANEGAGLFKAVELALDRIQRNVKIPGDRPAIGLAVMEQGEEHRLSSLATEQVLKRGR